MKLISFKLCKSSDKHTPKRPFYTKKIFGNSKICPTLCVKSLVQIKGVTDIK